MTEIAPPVVALTAALMLTGEAKLPEASDNCTVNVLPGKKLHPVRLFVMLKVAPAHCVDKPVGALRPGELMVRLPV